MSSQYLTYISLYVCKVRRHFIGIYGVHVLIDPPQSGNGYSYSSSYVIDLTESYRLSIPLGKLLYPTPSGKEPYSGSILHPYFFAVLGSATLFCNFGRSGLEITLFSRETCPVTEENSTESRTKLFTTPSVFHRGRKCHQDTVCL